LCLQAPSPAGSIASQRILMDEDGHGCSGRSCHNFPSVWDLASRTHKCLGAATALYESLDMMPSSSKAELMTVLDQARLYAYQIIPFLRRRVHCTSVQPQA
jgi:hypothetical protein